MDCFGVMTAFASPAFQAAGSAPAAGHAAIPRRTSDDQRMAATPLVAGSENWAEIPPAGEFLRSRGSRFKHNVGRVPPRRLECPTMPLRPYLVAALTAALALGGADGAEN